MARPAYVYAEDYDMPDSSKFDTEDSIKIAKAHIADSTKAARTFQADSIKEARKHLTDSVKQARQAKTDSTAAIRKYRDSKHFKDSVARSKLIKANKVKKSRQTHADSIKEARENAMDSIAAVRKTRSDSVKSIQKKRTDSIAAKSKYKKSKRYTDSVSITRHDHMDSLHEAQQKTRDSIALTRKHSLDSSKTIRKHVADSQKAVRLKFSDSLKAVHKVRADSLLKIKKAKEALAKAKDKKKEDALKFKLELKMKQKHDSFSNKAMLKHPWSPMRRAMQNSFTHYNYYYNANRKMDEALLNMQRSRKENYDSVIGLYPFDPNRDSSLMSSDMDTIVHKVSVAIQIHDPRVKWANDLYMLLGQAYYYRGRYENAAIAFRYIIASDEAAKKKAATKYGKGQSSSNKNKEAPSILEEEKTSKFDFLKHKSVHNESIVWLARTYTVAHQTENAESIMSLLESDAKLHDNMKGRVAAQKAFNYLAENNPTEASKHLAIAADDRYLPDWLRMRAAFINGQLQQNAGNYKSAATNFEKVLTYYPKIDMDFYSRKNAAFNHLLAGEKVDDAMKPLKKVLADGKYVSYYDQVYFVLGQLAAKANKPSEALGYYQQSVTTPKASKKQKALSFTAMGDLYYSSSRYANAKIAYDSASKYSAGVKDIAVKNGEQRTKGLTEISGPAHLIHDQDSLMALSLLSKKEQAAAVKKQLKYLERLRNDSIAKAEEAGVNAVAATDPDDVKDAASSWYFSNPTLMQQGSADFKRKWGNRVLSDNWRRGASANSGGGSGSDGGEDAPDALVSTENGLPTEGSLLAKIPNNKAQKDLSNKMVQKAYMLLAKAYMKQLEDYVMASQSLDTLDKRFPEHNQKEEELYLRYQIAIKQNKLDKAQQYADELIKKFPNSQYATNLKPKGSESKGDVKVDGKNVSAYFDETYALLQQRQYTEALMRVNIAKKQFDNPVYKKRFEIVEATAYAGMANYNQADTLITAFMKANTGDTLMTWASTVRQYIKDVRNGGKPSWYYDTLTTAQKEALTKKSEKAKADAEAASKPAPPPPPPDAPAFYSYHADSMHYCIIVLSGLDSRTSKLKKGIIKYDSANYTTTNLELVMDFFDIDQDVLVVKGFNNANDAKTYAEGLKTLPALQAYKPDEIKVLSISRNNYKKMFFEKTAQPYYGFYAEHYK